MTGSQDPRRSVVAGFLLRVIRESAPGPAPVTREYMAEQLALSPDYYSWLETGRRPLSAMRIEQSLLLRQVLRRAGCAPQLIELLDQALEADAIIDFVVRTGTDYRPGAIHPLDSWVLRRQTVDLIAWPLSSRIPSVIPTPPSHLTGRAKRPKRPELDAASRSRFFAHLRHVVDTTVGAPTLLLRRQALYLLSFDSAPETPAFLVHHRGRLPHGLAGWSEQWPAARSLAASITRHGDPTPLRDFIERGLIGDDNAEAANLNYFAYWVGEGHGVERDDTFMAERLGPWRGDLLLRHLTGGLDGTFGYVDLNVHSLWALIAARPHLLAEDSALRFELQSRVEQLLDARPVAARALSELGAIRYALRLHQ